MKPDFADRAVLDIMTHIAESLESGRIPGRAELAGIIRRYAVEKTCWNCGGSGKVEVPGRPGHGSYIITCKACERGKASSCPREAAEGE